MVVNITDVDDKPIIRARELNTTVKELAEKMTVDYVECLNASTLPASISCATEHIDGMIEIMKNLIDKGYAWRGRRRRVLDVLKDDDYGKLCNRDPEQPEAGARVEVSVRSAIPRLRDVESVEARRTCVDSPGAKAGPAGISNAPRCR